MRNVNTPRRDQEEERRPFLVVFGRLKFKIEHQRLTKLLQIK